MERYICIHGHFYQPPRENPWLEAIEQQDSAYPAHDWNERVTEECYEPNAKSRILDEHGWIVKIVNNYSRMSFNFGPTVLSWMANKQPVVHQAILEADKQSIERFSGHGSAIAQTYNHMIMPLSNERDRRTQVIWGIEDFKHRFARHPEGMWLPETAVNTASLEALADNGIQYTILAPRQAKRIRPIGGDWQAIEGGVDPSMPYLVNLPSGKSISVFFYDGPISQAVAFEGLLASGDKFFQRLISGFSDSRDGAQLMHIATDGETYGHHHRHGDMALAHALERIEADQSCKLTNYGEYLAKYPPDHEVEIIENSSWSCVHGVGRWKEDCGCRTGGRLGWNQAWRTPLRESLDWLRDTLIIPYEKAAGELLKNPWSARTKYIHVILDRSQHNIDSFFDTHAITDIDESQRQYLMKLLELQRHAMLMYTSCGWFFDELSGIETVQVIEYAGRVIQLALEVIDYDLEEEYLRHLEQAQSNIVEHGDGRNIYNKFVKPSMIDLPKVGAHYAISSLFESYGEHANIYCYDVYQIAEQRTNAGRAELLVGRSRFVSRVTLEYDDLSYAVLHLGEHVINCGVRLYRGETEYDDMLQQAVEAFNHADFTQVMREMDTFFGKSNYSLASLFRDEQRKVIRLVLNSTLTHVEGSYRQLYENYAPLLRFLSNLHIPAPGALRMPAGYVLNADLRESLIRHPPDVDELSRFVREAKEQSVDLNQLELSFSVKNTFLRFADDMLTNRPDSTRLEILHQFTLIIESLPFEFDRAPLQYALYTVLLRDRETMAAESQAGDDYAQRWLHVFDELCNRLRLRVQ